MKTTKQSPEKAFLSIKRNLGFFILMLGFAQTSLAQLVPFEEWISTTGTQNFFMRSRTVTDGSGNIYVAGGTVNGNGNYDILVSKFNSGGSLLWSQQIDGLAGFHDAATALETDGSGNVYITGFITDTINHGTDAFAAKFNSSGSLQWLKSYNGAGDYHDFGTDIIVDGSGNVYFTGSCQNATPNADILTIKYNSSGTQQWVKVINYAPANMDDAGARIKGLSTDRITLAVIVQLTATSYAYGNVVLNTSTGAVAGNMGLGTSSSSLEKAIGITQDSIGNTFIAGAIDNGAGHGLDYCIMKFDTTAALIWESYFNGANGLEDVATDVTVDDNGNVYVTGYSTTSSEETNYTTVKLDPSGSQIWEAHYNGKGNGADTAMAMTLHNDTTLVITGSSFNGDNQDYYSVKYDTSGIQLWEIGYNSYYNKADWAHSIAVDTLGAIIITGQSYNDTAISYTTVKYIDPYITDSLPDGVPLASSFTFIENRDQLINTDSVGMPGIKFYNNQQEYSSYFTDTLISYVFAAVDTALTTDDTLFRVDMRFVSPLAGAKVYGKDIRNDYHNYYLPQTAPNGRERVPLYNQLYMPSLWTNIDLLITSNPAGIKYAFVLNPGFDHEKPVLQFDGGNNPYDDHGTLIVETPLGNLVLPLADEAFQIDENGDSVLLGWQADYYVDDSLVSFTNLGSYDEDLPLVIVIEHAYSTPTPSNTGTCWSTYIGGNDDDVMCGIDVDNNGNQYVTGFTASTAIFPITINAYQSALKGSYDVFFTRFDSGHVLDYSTYFGGSQSDFGFDLKINSQDKIYITGYTMSDDFPKLLKPGAYNDTILNNTGITGRSDAFVAKFNPITGFPEWITFFGGDYHERAYSMDFDSNDNLYITGYTTSSDFPAATSGTFNPSYGGSTDGFIARFNASDARTWAAYIGGNNQDKGISICTDPSNNVFVQGISFSTSGFPHLNSGSQYIDNTLGGTKDIFIVKFSPAAAQLWGTFVGGSQDEYEAYNDGTGANAIKATNDFVYSVTSTHSSDMPLYYPGSPAFMDSTQSSTSEWNGHLFQFDASTLAPVWATYVSGTSHTLFSGVDIDPNGNIFIVGGTEDPLFPLFQVSGVYYQDTLFSFPATTFGRNDGLLLHFNPQREIKWATYFGGYNTSGAYGEAVNDLAIDGLNLYISGTTTTLNNSTRNFPLYDYGSGAYFDTTYNGGLQDGYISYFCLNNITSVNEIPSDKPNYLTIYPNPTDGTLTLVFPEPIWDNAKVDVYDISGRLVLSQSGKKSSPRLTIDLSFVAKGVYTVVAHNEKISYFSKIVRQ